MSPEQAEALRKPFPASAVGKLPKGGVQLDYVGHAATTDRLLAVDPEWSWEPFALDADGLPAFQGRDLWIRLTVCGLTRIGVGDGGSRKEAIGDAIRNAAMRFGVALDLWSKEELEQANGPAPKPVPAKAAAPQADDELLDTKSPLAKAMYASLREHRVDKESSLALFTEIAGRDITSSSELTAGEARRVLKEVTGE